MRSFLFCLCMLSVTAVPAAIASIVIHDVTSQPGIVAESEWNYLDTYGRVWRDEGQGYFFHKAEWDVPIPVERIKFWSAVRFVTVDDEFFWYDGSAGEWVSIGFWPGPPANMSSGRDVAMPFAARPNPTSDALSLQFDVASPGEISVVILDMSGRLVRDLLSGSHPAGHYQLRWDGASTAGRRSEAGVYLARITTPSGSYSQRLVLVE